MLDQVLCGEVGRTATAKRLGSRHWIEHVSWWLQPVEGRDNYPIGSPFQMRHETDALPASIRKANCSEWT